jgi:hypothetical protein
MFHCLVRFEMGLLASHEAALGALASRRRDANFRNPTRLRDAGVPKCMALMRDIEILPAFPKGNVSGPSALG